MKKFVEYAGIVLFALSSLLPISCKRIGYDDNTSKIGSINNKEEKNKILDIIFGEYRQAIDNIVDNEDMSWFVNKGFINRNMVGKNDEDLKELQKCFLSLKIYPIWSGMRESSRPNINPINAAEYLKRNPKTRLFNGELDALSNLDSYVVVDLNDSLEEQQKDRLKEQQEYGLFILMFKKDRDGYKIYVNKSIQDDYTTAIARFYTEIIHSTTLEKKSISFYPGCKEITKY